MTQITTPDDDYDALDWIIIESSHGIRKTDKVNDRPLLDHEDIACVVKETLDGDKMKNLKSLLRNYIRQNYTPNAEAERAKQDALKLVKDKYLKLEHGIFAIDYYINKPYPDDERWTPYSRFIHPRMIMVRKALEGVDVGELWAMGEAKRFEQLSSRETSSEEQELYSIFEGKTLKQNLQDIVAQNNTGYSYDELVDVLSNGSEELLEDDELEEVDKTVRLLAHLFKVHTSKQVELAVVEAKIEEQNRLIASIDENNVARLRPVVEGDNISYVDHGYSLLAKQIKHNANNRIAKLTTQKAALTNDKRVNK